MLKLTVIVAMSGTSYSLFSVLSLGLAMPILLKSMPQEILAENFLGRSEGRLLRSNVTAITGVLQIGEKNTTVTSLDVFWLISLVVSLT